MSQVGMSENGREQPWPGYPVSAIIGHSKTNQVDLQLKSGHRIFILRLQSNTGYEGVMAVYIEKYMEFIPYINTVRAL